MNTDASVKSNRPLLIAHRGAPQEAPENTQTAFERALSYPIDGIELDVQMSSDGVPVLFHDDTLEKAGFGQKRICDLNWQTLQELDAGAWFGVDFAGEPLLSYNEMLNQLGARTRLFVEIKSRDATAAEDSHDRLLVEKVATGLNRLVADGGRPEPALLCFNPYLAWYGHRRYPSLRWVLNYEHSAATVLSAAGLSADFLWAICGNISFLDMDAVTWAREHGLKVFTYTCNLQSEVQKALDLGLDAVITDRPAWLAAQWKATPHSKNQ